MYPENNTGHQPLDAPAPSISPMPATVPTTGNSSLETVAAVQVGALDSITSPDPQLQQQQSQRRHKRFVRYGLLASILIAGVVTLAIVANHPQTPNSALNSNVNNNFSNVNIPLGKINTHQSGINNLSTVDINGQLKVKNSLVLAPSPQPANAEAGQIYYNQNTNQLSYYDGTSYTNLLSGNDLAGIISKNTNRLSAGSGLASNGGVLTNTGVLSLQGQAGNISLLAGGGIAVNGTTISNNGVLSVGGSRGNIAIGSGLAINDNTLSNTGVVSITAGSNIQVTNNGSGGLTISSTASSGGTSGGLTSPGGTVGQLAKFIGNQSLADSLLSDDGTTVTDSGQLKVVGGASFSGDLAVTGALTATSLAGNGSGVTNVDAAKLNGQAAGYYQNAGNLNAGTISDARLSTNVALYNQATSNFTGVLQQSGYNVCDTSGNCVGVAGGAIGGGGSSNTIALFTGSGYTIGNSILTQNAGNTALAVAGDLSATGTISATNLSGDGTGVTNVNAATLEGQNGSYYSNANNIDAGTLSDSRLSTNVAKYNDATANFTGILQQNGDNVCTTAGNCTGVGGSIVGSGTANTIALFTDTGSIGDSLLTQDAGATTVTVGGSLAVSGTITATSLAGDGTGVTNVNAAQLNGQAGSYYQSANNITSGTLSNSRLNSNVATYDNTTSNFTGDLQHSGSEVCDNSNNCGYLTGSAASGSYIQLQGSTPGSTQTGNFNITGTGVAGSLAAATIYQNGSAVCDESGNCGYSGSGSGAGVASLNSLAGDLSLQGTTGQLSFSGSGTSIIASLDPQVSLLGQTIDNGELAHDSITIATDANLTGGGTAALGGSFSLGLGPNVSLLGQSIALGTETTGNYQSFTTAGDGITVTGTAGVGASPTVAVDSTVCRTSGNCAGVGGSITGSGTANTVALFTNTGAIGNSIITQNAGATSVGIAGTLNVTGAVTATSLSGDGSGVTSVNAAQLNGQPGSYYQDAGNIDAGTLADGRLSSNVAKYSDTTANFAGTLEQNSNQVCDNSNNCGYLTGAAADGQYIQLQGSTPGSAQTGNFNISGTGIADSLKAATIYQNGSQVCDESGNCGYSGSGTGAGVASLNGLAGDLSLQGTAGQISFANAGSTITASLDSNVSLLGQSIALGTETTGNYQAFTTAGDGITITGTAGVGASPTVAVDSTVCRTSGNCVGQGNPNNSVGGSGTVDTIALFTGSGYTIGDSLLSQDAGATTVTVGGDLAVSGNISATTGTITAQNLVGNGSGVTNVNAAELEGNGASYYTDASNLSTGTLNDGRLSSNAALYDRTTSNFTGILQHNGNNVCDTSGNCSGVGGSIVGGGTANTLALFTNTGSIGDSLLTQDAGGTTVTIGGSLTVSGNITTSSGTITAANLVGDGSGVTNVNAAELAGNSASYYTDASNIDAGTLANTRLAGGGALTVTAGNGLNGGGSVALGGSTTLTVNAASGGCLSVGSVGVAVSDNCVNAATLGGNTGSYYLNASNINTGTLGDSRLSTNIAKYTDTIANFAGTLEQNSNQVCDNSNNCGYLTGSAANGQYVQLQGSTPGSAQTGNLNISGTAIAGVIKGGAVYQNGNQVCDESGNCGYSGSGTGAGVASLNGLDGDLTLQGTAGQISFTGTGSTVTASLDSNVSLLGQSIALGSETTGNYQSFTTAGDGITVTGTAGVGASPTVAVDSTVCRTSGNCVGQGNPNNSVGGSGTVDTIALFTGSGYTIGDSLLSQDAGATTVTVGGDLAVSGNITTSTGTVSAKNLSGDGTGVTNVNAAELEGNAGSYYTNATNISTGTLADSRLSTNVAKYNDATANFTGVLEQAGNTVCDASNNCGYLTGSAASGQYIQLQGATPGTAQTGNLNISGTAIAGSVKGTTLYQNGNQVCDTSGNCGYSGSGTGAGVASLNSLAGDLTLQGTAGQISFSNAGSTVTASLNGSVSLLGQSITLGSETTGNYQSFTTAGDGITVTGTAGAGTSPSVAVDSTVCRTSGNCAAAGTAGGDLTGSYPNPTVAKIRNTNVSFSSIVSGDVLQYNGTNIVNAHISNTNLTAGTFSSITGTGALTAGSIGVGFGAINNGASGITSTGTISGTTVNGGTINQNGHQVCDTSGNCTTLGGQVTNGGTAGTTYTIAMFSGGQTIGDSILAQDSGATTITVTGDLTATGTISATSLVGDGSGVTGVNALQLSGQTGSYYTDAGNISSGTLSDSRLTTNVAKYNDATANFAGNLQQNGNDVCTVGGNCKGVGVGESGGAIGGSGTANTIALFNGSGYTIGDSILTQSGTSSIAVGGALSTTSTITVQGTGSSSIAGSLGIGTTTPGQSLDVQGGNVNTSGYYMQGGQIVINTTTGSLNGFIGTHAGNTTTTGTSNTAVGAYALQGNTTGNYNTATGFSTLSSNTTGSYNTAYGEWAMLYNTSGNNNSAFGHQALWYNSTGDNNTAVGESSLQNNTTGAENVAVGTEALLFNTIGQQNTALGYQAGHGNGGSPNISGNSLLGYQAGYSLQTGANYNTILGYSAGSSLTTGANNILIGQNVQAPSATGSNQLNIGNTIYGNTADGTAYLQTSSSNAFHIQNATGTQVFNVDSNTSTVQIQSSGMNLGSELFTSSYSFAAATGWTGISGSGTSATATHTSGGGTTALSITPTFPLTVGNTYIVTINVSGTTSGYLYASAGGVAAHQPIDYQNWWPVGSPHSFEFTATTTDNLQFTPTTDYNGTITGISIKEVNPQNAALQILDNTGSAAIDIRTDYGGGSSIFIGLDAGSYSIGGQNTAVGAYALQYNTTGYSNSAFGDSALTNNTTGIENSAFGSSALLSNTTGYDNTANGAYALSNNVDGSENTGFGEYALDNNTSGSQNVGLGGLALSTNATGSGNTGLGYSADVGADNLQNATAVGAYSYVTQSDSIVLGCVNGTNGCTATTKVGVGTTAPTALLQIKGSSSSAFDVQDGSGVDLLTADTNDHTVSITGGRPSDWTLQVAPNYGYNSIAYGDGMFVAVTYGTSPHVSTSPDGVTWTSRTASSGNWTSVTYGNGMFVAVSANTSPYVMTSPDGVTWTSRTALAGKWYSVTYGNGMFVAVGFGTSPAVMTSPDGVTWTSRTATTSNWHSVIYANGLFVAVSQSSPYVMTSPDGVTWTSRTAPAGTWNSVAYGDGMFVAVNGDTNANNVMTSPDGVTWTSRTAPAGNWRSVIYANSMFVAVGFNFPYAMTSTDGITWVSQTAPSASWESVAYGNSVFVAIDYYGYAMVSTNPSNIPALVVNGDSGVLGNLGVGTTNPVYNLDVQGSTGVRVQTTTDTTTAFQVQDSMGNTILGTDTLNSQVNISGVSTTPSVSFHALSYSADEGFTSTTYGNGMFVAVGTGTSSNVMTSPDGVTWTAQSAPVNNWRSVTYGNGMFVAVSWNQSPYVMTSPDGVTWTSRTAPAGFWSSIIYANGIFVAVGAGTSSNVMTSPDGVTWTAHTAPYGTSSVVYANGKFIAVGSSGYPNNTPYFMTSTDGITWTAQSAPYGAESVTYGNGMFVAVGASCGSGQSVCSYTLTSPDGITWAAHTAPTSEWNSVTYANGLFVAVGRYNPYTSPYIMTSTDGITWTAQSTPASLWQSVAYGNGMFVAVGETTNGSPEIMFSPASSGLAALNITGGSYTDTLSVGAGAKPVDSNTKLQVYGNSTVSGNIQVGSATTSGSAEHPLQTADTSAVTTNSAAYTMGYSFTPTVSGQVTQLGVRCTAGSYTLTLWTSTGTQLATATGTATGASSWAYTDITPVSLTAGTTYVVSEYGSSYCYNSFTTPVTTGHITITNSIYTTSGNAFPTTTNTTTMYGQADITFVPSTTMSASFSSKVGIGTATPGYMLDVQDIQNTGYVAQISNNSTQNTADGLLINLGVTTSTRSTGNYYIGFAASGTIAGKIYGNGSSVSYISAGADYAEYFKADPNNLPQPGELLVMDTASSQAVTQASDPSKPFVGAVSTNPGFIGNGPVCNTDDTHCDEDYAKYNVLVALNGQVPVKVSTENGPIATGDPITVSATTPGIGVKATSAGYIVGYALEPAAKDGTIQVLIRPSYLNPAPDLQGSNAVFNSVAISGALSADSINVGGLATIGSLTVSGDATFQDNITVSGDVTLNAHLITTGATPTIQALPVTGSQDAAASINGNDISGVITIKTGSSPAVGDLAKLSFAKAYGQAPHVMITPNDAASANLLVYASASTTGSFNLSVVGQPKADTTYSFTYYVVQ